ncbi:hypothetical protein WJX81_004173 [Elliptochloris bilobata]|uniref:Uncharacterized protein n=1 Tax=Elliptochloris bilobata TaxID=381761 RepID=A0AAW1REM2_9CHLO
MPCASPGRFRLPYKYVVPAYLTVFVVGVLLGMAFSPATPQELQWLAERSPRLRAARELPSQAASDGRFAPDRISRRRPLPAQAAPDGRFARGRIARGRPLEASNVSFDLTGQAGGSNRSTADLEEQTVELRHLEAETPRDGQQALVAGGAGSHEETR